MFGLSAMKTALLACYHVARSPPPRLRKSLIEASKLVFRTIKKGCLCIFQRSKNAARFPSLLLCCYIIQRLMKKERNRTWLLAERQKGKEKINCHKYRWVPKADAKQTEKIKSGCVGGRNVLQNHRAQDVRVVYALRVTHCH